ncbi:(2Fe-2S)-binding protein [Pseudalkalibacillus decolorationis]|uniref:(2Fe-2S)-binding protein n=1 Tax=Pseudalkalibacillus decolorationis TaxID=163879 RepID=UPI0027E301B8|nr:(2Fe-2S)-binding protein [Pseudalkalibacillus decolorationis]
MREDMIICRCEEVTYKDIYQTVEHHQCSSRETKLRTRAGMGYCGGRTCRTFVDQIVAEVYGEPSGDAIPLKYRPPVRPIPFKTMGGK